MLTKPPLPLDDPFYRPRKISELTGIHVETIRLEIRKGKMKAEMLGKRAIGVRASEVQRWLDGLQERA
jgi:excisionase family DNA binding protein